MKSLLSMRSPLSGKFLARAALVAGLLLAWSGLATAKEPVEQFLEKLRERELFDAAEWYLETLKTNPNVDAETKQVIPYEQARIIVEMSKNERVTSERLKKLDAAKTLFTDFLKNNAAHSYANLARVQLGNLLVERAKALVSQAEREKKPDEKKKILLAADAEFKAARKELEQAVKDFDAAVKKFPAFVPKEQADVRKKKNDARRDLIEASMYLGGCIYEQAQAFEKQSKERKQYLTEAATAFHKIYEMFRGTFAGMYAGTWEARCFQEQGELSRALGLYLEIMSVDSTDDNVRGLQIKSLRMAMEAWNDPTQRIYAESIDRGERFLKAAHGEDDDSPDGLAIKFLVAQAMDLTLDAEKKTNPKEAKPDPKAKGNKINDVVKARYVSTIKKYCAEVVRARSEYRKQALVLLEKYNGKLDPNALPTNFADAFGQAKDKFAFWQSCRDIEGDDKKTPEEKEKARADGKTAADDTIRLLRLSLELKERDKSANIEDVHAIRYYLTFLYYSTERYYEAALQGEFLARHYPQFSAANHAGFIAMAAWIYLYNDTGAVDGKKKVFEIGNLVRVAELLTAKWPNTDFADNAWLMLADIRIREQDFKEAAEFLEKIAAASPRRPDADLKHGQALWSQYLVFMRMKTPPPADQLKKLIDDAEGRFKKGLDAKRKAITESSQVQFPLLAAELSLAQLQISRGTADQAKAAIETLAKKDGFLPLYKAGHDATKDKNLTLEAHKVLLRSYVTSRNIAEAKKILGDLDKMFADAAARALFYRALGQEISQQLKTAPPAEQEALEDAFYEFTATLTANPATLEDSMLIWAAESNLAISEAALKRGAAAKPKAKQLCTRAAELYKLLIDKKKPLKDAAATAAAPALTAASALPDGEDKQKAIREAEAPVKKIENEITVLTIRSARALRLAQSYSDAYEALKVLLLANDNILDAQFEMCEVFLDWAADTDSRKFAPLRQGVPAGAKQPIWGLALISRKLQPFVKDPKDPKETEEARKRREEYRGRFYEAYLMYSKSYLVQGEKPDAKDNKKKLLEAGANRVQTLWNLYSEELEASKEWYDSFDKLLKDLQRAQGQDPSGLKGLPKPTPKKAPETTAAAAAPAAK